MKQVTVTFEKVTDTTGYLFSFAKCLSAALASAGYESEAEDVIAASGFAFRTWAAADLCPSAMSIWEFKKQKPWTENTGLSCDYAERMWGEGAIDEERRAEAIRLIRESVERGIAAVAWDISGAEWGLINGYDGETETLSTVTMNGTPGSIPYEKLGHLDLPILSVLTVTGKKEKNADQLVSDTKAMAASHLREEEWCDNAQGLAAYDTMISFVKEKLGPDTWWNLEYYLGTYAALRYHAWKFFEKYGEHTLADLYETVYRSWQRAFEKKIGGDASDTALRAEIAELLQCARDAEAQAIAYLS